MRISDWSSDVCSSDLKTATPWERPAPSETVARVVAERPCSTMESMVASMSCRRRLAAFSVRSRRGLPAAALAAIPSPSFAAEPPPEPPLSALAVLAQAMVRTRSEEHTSNSSHNAHLVCRLLLEKTTHTTTPHYNPPRT